MTSYPRTEVVVSKTEGRTSRTSSRPTPGAGDSVVRSWSATGTIDDLPAWTRTRIGDDVHHRVAVVHDASALDDETFERRTASAYESLLVGVPSQSLLRAWNFIPRINDFAGGEPGESRDRYMRFNAGRYRGFRRRYAETPGYPVASGVGHAGDDLVVHLLHGSHERRIVDNGRQTPPQAYSNRFGSPPPVFARAACVDAAREGWLLVSGTASVVGEDSLHRGSIEGQIEETLRNLEAVVGAGWSGASPADLQDWLVYVPNADDAIPVSSAIRARWPHAASRIVIREQSLCRPELLVEIECAGFRGIRSS